MEKQIQLSIAGAGTFYVTSLAGAKAVPGFNTLPVDEQVEILNWLRDQDLPDGETQSDEEEQE